MWPKTQCNHNWGHISCNWLWLYYIRDHDETTIIIRGHYLKPRQQIYLPTGIILQLITKSSMNKLRRRKKGKNKNYPVLLNTSIAGANAPTPGKTKRLAFKMSSGVWTYQIQLFQIHEHIIKNNPLVWFHGRKPKLFPDT